MNRMFDYFDKLNLKAVGIGAAIDIFGRVIFFSLMSFVWISILVYWGVQCDDIESQLTNSTLFLVISLFLGLTLKIGGGFVAALIAKSNQLLNSSAVGAVNILLGLWGVLRSPDEFRLLFTAISSLLVIPAALLGGYLRMTILKANKGI